jgi:ribosome modulation factor
MSQGCRTASSGVFPLLILLGFALVADAQTPTSMLLVAPVPARKRPEVDRKQTATDPCAQRQVMALQIGFEAQQQGYVSKVQGAASQNVIWVTSHEQRSRQSWLGSWLDFFDD